MSLRMKYCFRQKIKVGVLYGTSFFVLWERCGILLRCEKVFAFLWILPPVLTKISDGMGYTHVRSGLRRHKTVPRGGSEEGARSVFRG